MYVPSPSVVVNNMNASIPPIGPRYARLGLLKGFFKALRTSLSSSMRIIIMMLVISAFLTIKVPAGPDDIGVSIVHRMNTSIAWKMIVFMMLLSSLALNCPVNAPAMNTKRLVQKLTFC